MWHDRTIVLGGGGHAAVLIDALSESGEPLPIAILDNDRARWGQSILEVAIEGGDALLADFAAEGVRSFVVGVGSVSDCTVRKRLFELGLSQGLEPRPVLHPRAFASSTARRGSGVQLLAGSIVNTAALLGDNVIVNTGAVVEHHCRVGDHVHVASGAVLCGNVNVGEGSHIGAGATVRQDLSIGPQAVVGAGAVVVKDVPARTVVAGVPARVMRTLEL